MTDRAGQGFRPHLTGFSVLFSQQLFFALALAKLLGERRRSRNARLQNRRGRSASDCLRRGNLSVMPDPGRLLAGPVPVYLGNEPGGGGYRSTHRLPHCRRGRRGLEALTRSCASPGRSSRHVLLARPRTRNTGASPFQRRKSGEKPARRGVCAESVASPGFF